MPYRRFTKTVKGKKRWCAENVQTGKVVCYDSKVERERGLKIRMSYAGEG